MSKGGRKKNGLKLCRSSLKSIITLCASTYRKIVYYGIIKHTSQREILYCIQLHNTPPYAIHITSLHYIAWHCAVCVCVCVYGLGVGFSQLVVLRGSYSLSHVLSGTVMSFSSLLLTHPRSLLVMLAYRFLLTALYSIVEYCIV